MLPPGFSVHFDVYISPAETVRALTRQGLRQCWVLSGVLNGASLQKGWNCSPTPVVPTVRNPDGSRVPVDPRSQVGLRVLAHVSAAAAAPVD